MRKIKFRAWDKISKKMYDLKKIFEDDVLSQLLYVNHNTVQGKEDLIFLQFTGLKDKNNEMIYEGDIVENETGTICEVIFLSWGDFCGFCLKKINDIGYFSNIWSEQTIIGNIYENKELLNERN
jgi:uncharacterized phage protein (TIGR01671 family)